MNQGDKRGWRLLSDLNNAFKRDREIDEFDFLPVLEPKNNCSPIVLVDHKLGIELWSVKILYQYAYNTLMEWRGKSSHKFLEAPSIVSLTRGVVLLNADCLTAWNIRKELVESGDISTAEDFKLSALVLTKHPKSSETFCHRRWLLSRYIDNHLQSSQGSTLSTGSAQDGFVCMDAIDLNIDPSQHMLPVQNGNHVMDSPADYHHQMKTEFSVCTCAAERYPCNYYAWSHRVWLMQHAYNCSVQVILVELERTESWVEKHVSDTCGFQYRQFLWSSLQSQAEGVRKQYSLHVTSLLEKEHRYILDLIRTYPGHEAMWYYRRYVFQTLYTLYISESKCTSPRAEEGPAQNHQKKTRLEYDSHLFQEKELDAVQSKDLKSSSPVQKRLAQNYVDWLHRVVIK